MAKLNEVTRNKIARNILIHRMATGEFNPNVATMKKKSFRTAAKNIGVKPCELREFIHEITPEVIAAKIGCKTVSIEW